MKKYLTLGIFAHANAGKTTLTENLLFLNKKISSVGRVDNGDTVTDDLLVERNRGITVRSSLVSIENNDNIIQIIDTPGHVDFSSEVERAMNVLDFAILVVSAVEGVESQTYTIWKELRKNNIPTIIFVNKIDRLNADYGRTLNEIKEKLSDHSFSYVSAPGEKKLSAQELLEKVADFDDVAAELYINDKKVSDAILDKIIIERFNSGEIFPVFCGSALKSVGIDAIYNFLGQDIANNLISSDDLNAYIYMVRINNGLRDSYIKILSGSMVDFTDIFVSGEKKKITNMRTAVGGSLVNITSAVPGQIIAVNGLDCTCGTKIGNYQLRQSAFVQPLIKMQIIPRDPNDISKLIEVIKILNAEDPHYEAKFDEYTKEIKINLMGEVQGQVLQEVIYDRFGLQTEIINPKIIYKETPTREAQGKASYTSVSQIELKVTPLARGSGQIINSKYSTDFLHVKYQNQAKRLIKQYCQQGLYGWEITDAEISIIGGKFDSMGSDPQHFNICTPLALFRALKRAEMRVLEPVIHFNISTPIISSNNVVNCLYSKKAKIVEFKQCGEFTRISGLAPFEEMVTFPIQLNKLSSGLGSYSYEFEKYRFSDKTMTFDKRYGPDPANEVRFVINDMQASLASLDNEGTGKRLRRSKFAREQMERAIAEEKKKANKGPSGDNDFFEKGM